MNKQKTTAFNNKDVYLLGKDSEGVLYWLEAPSFDCGWYWGFGYVETYLGNENPSKAKDIDSHLHIDTSFIGSEAGEDGKYCHNIHDCAILAETTFTEKEGWELSDLFKSFYLLKQMAEFTDKGYSYLSEPKISKDCKRPEWTKEINENLIPKVTARILEILSTGL